MAIEADTLIGAKKLRPRDVEALLAEHLPRVRRMAYGLSGRDDVGHGIVRFVMTHAVKSLPHWRDPDQAERWFYHHTVLTERRASKHQPRPQEDLLVGREGAGVAAYVAFIRAVRALPVQQREAFILHHGEKWNMRWMAVSMDCSTQATEMHLRVAEETIQAVAGDAYPALLARMVRTYQSLTLSPQEVESEAGSYASRWIVPQRVRRWIRLVLIVAALGAAAWAVWRFVGKGAWE